MRDYVNEHFRAQPDRIVRKGIKLKNGKWLSIQASDGHYCSPRLSWRSQEREHWRVSGDYMPDNSPYSCVEVMVFKDSKGNRQQKCIDGWENWFDGYLYAFIPIDVVNAYIERVGLSED